ncbi:MAG: EAL domain-containing protein [Catonella sp.]|nr:EAL domain-containing protein [Catonella sp.]MDY6357172.1 EAL domain-containing protein [Catonella sp.]
MDDEEKHLREYVTNNIDRAISDGYIRVFYQPVIRTITGELCSAEALARWVDPEYGILSPGIFIPELEKTRQIYKLDTFMIHQICEDYAHMNDYGKTPFAVSFNVSRLDFDQCDIFGILNDEADKYNVPRHSLNVEITESVLGREREFLAAQIDHFHSDGYEVWMDDFGSDYSSLNSLKDYNFDEIKIDMKFLSSFSVRARNIVLSVVEMAKRLGIQTLAEGVETEEQLDFLREIGCEKAQGYFYSKPVPLYDLLNVLMQKKITIENAARRQYFVETGRVNMLSSDPFKAYEDTVNDSLSMENQVPSAICEYGEGKFRFLNTNTAFMNELMSVGIPSTGFVEKSLNSPLENQYRGKMLQLVTAAKDSKQTETMDFTVNNCLCQVKFMALSRRVGYTSFLVTLRNLSFDKTVVRQQMRSDYIPMIYDLFYRVDILDLVENKVKTLFNGKALLEDSGMNLRDANNYFIEHNIYPDDKARYKAFFNFDDMKERLLDEPKHVISGYFRIKANSDRDYTWTFCILKQLREKEGNLVLSLMRDAFKNEMAFGKLENYGNSSNDEEPAFTPEVLWKNLIKRSDINLFWKDTDRKFVGVSNAFLDAYGFEDDSAVIGKNDEEVGWHVKPAPFKSDEEAVLTEGASFIGVPGECIIDGELKKISATKFPIYSDGKLIGLMGYFRDVDNIINKYSDMHKNEQIDEVTGLFNAYGSVGALYKFADTYERNEGDFALIYLDIRDYTGLLRSYGPDWCSELLKEVANGLREVVGVTGVIGRLDGDHFTIIKQFGNSSEIKSLIEKIREKVLGIHDIDGNKCTVYISVGYALYSEMEEVEHIRHLASERLEQDKKQVKGSTALS